MNVAAASVLPLKRYAAFHGRASRTEVASFYVLTAIFVLLTGAAARWLGRADTITWFGTVFLALTFLPSLALGVRRLHDTGRSGWWLLLALPWVPATIWDFIAHPRPWSLPMRLDLPWWAMVPVALCTLALAILLLLDDDVDTNRYGPNPRGWPPGEPA